MRCFKRVRADGVRQVLYWGVAAVAIGCPAPNAKSPPRQGSWLVLLCKAADVADEPHPPTYYEELFSRGQDSLLFDYFDAISNHTVDVSGTEVYGWFPMNVTSAEIGPNVRNAGTPVTRTQTARDCKASALGGMIAQGFSVDPANYAGIVAVINVPVDSGSAGDRSVVIWGDPDLSFYEHEMLHELGLDHSWVMSPDSTDDHIWNHGGDREYGDCWDIMSYRSCVFEFSTSKGFQGPGLQAAYRAKLGWLPQGRSTTISRGRSTLKLAPLGDEGSTEPLLAILDVRSGAYLVEYRTRARFDRAIPSNSVIIREQRNQRLTYLVRRKGGGTAWLKGDTFTASGDFLSIHVDDLQPEAATITIDTNFSAGPVGLGEICGDKFHGEVRQCPVGSECRAKRVGQELVTTDYFCL